ncbi:DUF1656 domain-containing protein [Kistimonas asteriae]|uniref:DUF1656 domain-containing protein n=1 Tax=Kistimonas asteriae TaxID=517724 RepID=UPI001BAAB32E|nr:DUF1656 domain-containing protein [Kistimonas asteriae]
MSSVPHEIAFLGIFCPPLLTATVIGMFLAWAVNFVLTRLQLSHYLASPQLVYLALTILFTNLVGSRITPF